MLVGILKPSRNRDVVKKRVSFNTTVYERVLLGDTPIDSSKTIKLNSLKGEVRVKSKPKQIEVMNHINRKPVYKSIRSQVCL